MKEFTWLVLSERPPPRQQNSGCHMTRGEVVVVNRVSNRCHYRQQLLFLLSSSDMLLSRVTTVKVTNFDKENFETSKAER